MTADEIRAMLAAATPGPWWFDNNEGYGANNVWANHKVDTQAKDFIATAVGDSAEAEANARLIAAAPTIAADAITQAEQLAAAQAEIERLRGAMKILSNELSWNHKTRGISSRIDAALKEPKP